MTRRSKRYFVQLENQQMFRIPAARWHSWALAGMLILISDRVAKPAAPGVVWLENGELHYLSEPISPFMNLNCRVIERHAIFDIRGPKLDSVVLQREIQRAYGGRD
jgi:hypothetical protein